LAYLAYSLLFDVLLSAQFFYKYETELKGVAKLDDMLLCPYQIEPELSWHLSRPYEIYQTILALIYIRNNCSLTRFLIYIESAATIMNDINILTRKI